jgi:hypothetical protein
MKYISAAARYFTPFMETEGSLSHSQKPYTGPYPKPNISTLFSEIPNAA